MARAPANVGPLRIGRYEVIGHLATGGMAQIYLARQTGPGSFERHVVLKTILRERTADPRFVTMFLDEARLAATLDHHNVAQVYEVDHVDGAYFMAMEYVHGESARAILETTIRRGFTIPLELAVRIVRGAAAGLHHAHERRGESGQPLHIVHRDVSPARIMVGYDGSVKVLGFGTARAEERAAKAIGGTIKGKYGYRSPEQCQGKPIDRRSDLFALGIVLYELTTLHRAFESHDDFETMRRIVAGDLVPPSTAVPGFPRELEAILSTALAGDPGARFQTAQELIDALDAFAVRAKLTSSNAAMGRFLLQLFGTRKLPWIDAAERGTAHAVVTSAGHAGGQEDVDDDDGDDDETLVRGRRRDVQRAPSAAPAGTAVSPPPAALAPPAPVAERTRQPNARRTGEPPSLALSASPAADRATAAEAPSSEPRPSDPDLAPGGAAARGGPGHVAADVAPAVPAVATSSGMPPVAAPSGPIRPSAAAARPLAPSGLPALVAEDISEVGAAPLITDPKLGWNTSIQVMAPGDGSHTRLASGQVEIRIRPRARWVILAIGLALVVAAMLVLVIATWYSPQ